jgi:hypothetical protein
LTEWNRLCKEKQLGVGNSPVVPYHCLNQTKAMTRTIEGHQESSYLAKIEADRQAQDSGYGVRKFHAVGGIIKWEAYGWECITELTRHYTSYALFDHKWEAEQYFNNILNG